MASAWIDGADMRRIAFAAILCLSASLTHAQQQSPLEGNLITEALSLLVESFETRDSLLGEAPPPGGAYLTLRAQITNRHLENAVTLPPVQEMFALDLGARGADLFDPFWGVLALAPGETRLVEMAFAIPGDAAPDITLLYLGEGDARALQLAGTRAADATVQAEGRNSDAALTVHALSFADSHGDFRAPAGHRLALVDFSLQALRPPRGRTALARFLALVEDGSYVSQADAASTVTTPFVGWPEALPAGVTARARAVFVVPSETGDLAFQLYTPSGPLALDLTPDIPSPEPSEALSAPEQAGGLRVTLYDAAERPDIGLSDAALRIVAIDIGLKLEGARTPVFPLRVGGAMALIDGAGAAHAPVDIGARLHRPLGDGELWEGQEYRGAVAFAVPVAWQTFFLEVQGPGETVSVIVPVRAVEPAPEPEPVPELTGFDAAIETAGGEDAFGRAIKVLRRRWQRLDAAGQQVVLDAFERLQPLMPALPPAATLRRLVLRGGDSASVDEAMVSALLDDAIDGLALGDVASALGLPRDEALARLSQAFADMRPNTALVVDGGGRLRLATANQQEIEAAELAVMLRRMVPQMTAAEALQRTEAAQALGLGRAATVAGAAFEHGIPAASLGARFGLDETALAQVLLSYLDARGPAVDAAEQQRRVAAYLAAEAPIPEPEPPAMVTVFLPLASDGLPTPAEPVFVPPQLALALPAALDRPPRWENAPIDLVTVFLPAAPSALALPRPPIMVAAIDPSVPLPSPLPLPWRDPEPEPEPQDPVAALLAEAEALRRADKLTTPVGESAIDRYRQVLGLDPGNAAALAGIAGIGATYRGWGRSNLARGNNTKAATYFNRAVAVDARDGTAHALLGLARQRSGDIAGAEAAYRDALAIDPGIGDLHRALGLMLYRAGRYAETASALGDAARNGAGDATTWLYFGLSAIKLGSLNGAESAFRAGMEAAPADARLHRELGYLLLELQRHGEAASELETAERLDPSDLFTPLYLGLTYRALGDLSAADAAFERHRCLLATLNPR